MLQDKHLNIAKEIVLSLIDKERVTVFLFDSRVDSEYRSDSDLVDFSVVSDEFKQIAMNRIVEWNVVKNK